MLDEFEEFHMGPNSVSHGRPRVSLNVHGMFMLNSSTVNLLGNPEAVLLYYDRRNQRIGIRPGDADLSNSFPLNQNSSKYIYRICGNTFCRYHRIRTDEPVVFKEIEITPAKMLILDLTKASRKVPAKSAVQGNV